MRLQLAQPHEVLKDLQLANCQQPAMCEAPVVEVGCGLCGRTDGFVTVHERLVGIATPSRVLQCPDCGLVFLSPRLASTANDWAQYISYLESNYLPELLQRGICSRPLQFDRYGNLRWHAQLLDALDDFRTRSTLLDGGCSVGPTLRAANDRGWSSHGVESSAVLATYGADQLAVDITIGEFDKVPLPWRDLDCVTMLDYLPHCFEPFRSIRLAHGLLREGGALFVSAPNVTGRAHREHGTAWCCWVTDHYIHYDADTLMRSLRDAGFRSVVVLHGKPLPCARLGRQRGRLARASKSRVYEVLGPSDGDALYAWAIK
jgi:SAM-dependent methyltransferase